MNGKGISKECRMSPEALEDPMFSRSSGGVNSPPWENGMRAMVHQLQGTSSAGSSEIFLFDPYAKQFCKRESLPAIVDPDATQSSPEPYPLTDVCNRFHYSFTSEENILPPETTRTLLDIFLCHFSPRHFFFLDPSPFRQAVDAHPPVSPGLLHTMYLWASRLSSKAASTWHLSEAQLLARTGDELARAIGASDAHGILQIIQAAVLLSLYYLDAGRLVEGRHHCAGATSLAFSAGLHQLEATPRASTPPFVFAPVAQHPFRGREQIAAFWSVVLLNNYWVAASGVPSSIPADPSIMKTPWVLKSVTGDDTASDDPTTLLVQASILLERTIVFSMRDSGSKIPSRAFAMPPLTAPAPDAPELWALDARLEAFRAHLTRAPTDKGALVTHALVNAALVRLHAPHGHLAKCLAAAHCVGARLAAWDPTHNEKVDPILGVRPTSGSSIPTALSLPTSDIRFNINVNIALQPLLRTLVDVCIPHLALPTVAADLYTILEALTALAPGSELVQQCLASVLVQFVCAFPAQL
ncbi:hypothetical protein FB451DRAFT_1414999 [Mycena latifolia]|nr:hypothetical protein FB451DRAFT_1414999 [Mycena latifolia]